MNEFSKYLHHEMGNGIQTLITKGFMEHLVHPNPQNETHYQDLLSLQQLHRHLGILLHLHTNPHPTIQPIHLQKWLEGELISSEQGTLVDVGVQSSSEIELRQLINFFRDWSTQQQLTIKFFLLAESDCRFRLQIRSNMSSDRWSSLKLAGGGTVIQRVIEELVRILRFQVTIFDDGIEFYPGKFDE